MAKTQKRLMLLFIAFIAISLLLVAAYETNLLLPGDKAEALQTKFVVAVAM